MQISSAVGELRSSLALIDLSSDHYRRLTDILEEVSAPLLVHIRDVEAAMKELAEAKDKLEMLYSRDVGEKVHAYY
jgi:hypothetical protein